MRPYEKPPLGAERLGKIRILAFDMDDTLLDARGELSPGSRAALRRAVGKGYHVVIASGRVLSALPRDVTGVEGIQYAVTSNGAHITELATGRILYEDLLDPETVDAVLPFLADRDVMTELFFDGAAYASRADLARLGDFGRGSEKTRRYVLSTRKPVDDIAALLVKYRDRMENINLNLKDDEKRRRMAAALRELPGVSVTSSTPVNIEIGSRSASKAAALAALAARFGLGMENVMAFGDSENDLEMLEAAGVGVAVGNAVPVILEAADYIAPRHDEDGAAYALEKLLGI